MTQHVQNVTALRGAACLLVILAHLYTWDVAFGNETPVFREVRWFGMASLDLFFALSGFIITATNRKYFGKPAAVPGYFYRRAWRIYPTFWAAMALCALSGWALFDWQPLSADALRGWPAWLALAPSENVNPYIGQAWTMVYEVVFYCVIGAVLCHPPRAAAAALGGWGLLVTAALTMPVPANPWLAMPLSPFVFEFLGGAGVAWLAGRGVRGWWRTALAVAVGYTAVAVVVVAARPEPYGLALTDARLRVLAFGAPSVLIVYGLVAAEGRWPRRVPRWLLWCGDASYSLYLIHFQVILASVLVGMKLPHTRLPHLMWLAGTLAAVFAVGYAFYTLVERPLLNLGRHRRKPGTPVAVPGNASTRRAA